MNKIYSGIDQLPRGKASETLLPGCIVLEGGAFRGLYTGGVLDCLMLNDINLECTIGVSAGAMNGYSYTSGQIGRSSRFNLSHRHDDKYVGLQAMVHNKGIFGFDLIFDDSRNGEPLDWERFMDPSRRFLAVATDCRTGRPAYFEKGKCPDILQAIRASASMPLFSKMVYLEGRPYLDGGCCENIPLDWALNEGYEKIIIVKTRDRSYRKTKENPQVIRLQERIYRKYPEFLASFRDNTKHYNAVCDRIDQLEKEGRIYVIAPSKPVTVSRLEKDMEKLGALYHLGFSDVEAQLDEIRNYLS